LISVRDGPCIWAGPFIDRAWLRGFTCPLSGVFNALALLYLLYRRLTVRSIEKPMFLVCMSIKQGNSYIDLLEAAELLSELRLLLRL